MRIGNIEFVAWTWLSDAFENLCTLISNSYNYDGKDHSTLEVQYGNGEEYDLYEEDYEMLEKKYPNWSQHERIDYFYSEICEREGLMLVTYEQLEQLEELLKKKKVTR